MRDLFNQDRAMSPALIRVGVGLLGALLGVTALVVVAMSLGNMFSGRVFAGVVQLAGGLGCLLALYLVVRLLAEAVMALHRLNDRMTVLGVELGAVRPQDTKPVQKPKPVRRVKATKSTPQEAASSAESGETSPKG